MPSFLGQLSFRSYRRSSPKFERNNPSSSSSSKNNSNTNILINTTETSAFLNNALLEDLESLVQCTTPLSFDNGLYTEQQNLTQDQEETEEPQETSTSSSNEVVPIFHPNEVLLQQFPNKTSMKRPSEIRLHKADNTNVNKINNNNEKKKPSRKSNAAILVRTQSRNSPTAQLTTTRRFRSSSLIEHLTRISSRNSNNNNTSSPNDLFNEEMTTNPLTNLTNNTFHANSLNSQTHVTNGSVPVTTTSRHAAANAIAQPTLENFHKYLTRDCTPGTLYVTTERLLFVPLNAPSAAPTHPQFDILISAIDTMKAIQSDLGQWYFLCYEGPYISTIPFKSHSRARSFLRLVANIRFEQMVRRSLPPKYVSPTGTERACGCIAAAARHDMCSVMCGTCACADVVDWDDEDERLPTYSESEEAVRQHLVSIGLLAEDCPFDRQNSTFDVISMLAQACLPPNRDSQVRATRETPYRRNSDPERGTTTHAGPQAARRASVPPQPRPLTLHRRLGAYAADEGIYDVPLVWI